MNPATQIGMPIVYPDLRSSKMCRGACGDMGSILICGFRQVGKMWKRRILCVLGNTGFCPERPGCSPEMKNGVGVKA